MYEPDDLTLEGTLHLLDEIKSPREHDGPRHVWPSRNGKLLYAVSITCAVLAVLPASSDVLSNLCADHRTQ